MTPATSPSFFAASIMPRLRNIGPPGSANALISFWLTTSKRVAEFRVPELRGNAGDQPRADALDVAVDAVVVEHRQLRRACCAASCPICTSCAGVYLFLSGVMTVCAEALPSRDRQHHRG